jgi:hypothetical protein
MAIGCTKQGQGLCPPAFAGAGLDPARGFAPSTPTKGSPLEPFH